MSDQSITSLEQKIKAIYDIANDTSYAAEDRIRRIRDLYQYCSSNKDINFLVRAATNYVALKKSNLSVYISANGIGRGSPWGELVDAVDAIKSAMPAPLERPAGHHYARQRIAKAVHQIQVICDEFGYDPCEWLASEEPE